MREHMYYTYIVASRSRNFYVGMTSDIEGRVWQHKNEVYEGFSQRYRCHRLVYFERYVTAAIAIAREKQLKRWSRTKKVALIEQENSAWEDLSEQWGTPIEPFDEAKMREPETF